MATKNLARTVIEGGRDGYSRFARRHSNSRERVAERQLSHEVRLRVEVDDVVYPMRRKVYRSFADKLSPGFRWLERQAGRPWDLVRSELFQRFDTRTTAGRHFLFDHLLPELERHSWGYRVRRFYVDQHGILRCLIRRRKPKRPKEPS
jgi:hypothetical protein